MRKIMMTIAGSTVLCGTALFASANELAPPTQAPMQAPAQAPKQAPMQAPAPKQAPMQAPTPKQAPAQAPVQKNVQAPTQSPVQKGGKYSYEASPSDQYVATRPGLFRRGR
jgi:hypothetical protein